MLIQTEYKKMASYVKKPKLAIVNMEAHRPAVRKIQSIVQAVSVKPAASSILLPPKDKFNTGYLKARTNDPL